MNIAKIFCLSLGMMCHAKTFLTACRFRMDRRFNGFGIRLKGLGNPFKKNYHQICKFGRTKFDIRTVLWRDEVLISLFILLQVLLSS